MTTLQEAAQRALEALKTCYDVDSYPANGETSQDRAIADLTAALASEPQACLSVSSKCERQGGLSSIHEPQAEPVEQPGAVGLSEEQIEVLFCDAIGIDHDQFIMGTLETYQAGQWFKRGYKAALAAAQPVAPGWKLVPVEPTEAMIEAICSEHAEAGWPDGYGKTAQEIRRCHAAEGYQSALAAAPTFAATQGAKT